MTEKPVSALTNTAISHRRKDLLTETLIALLDSTLTRETLTVEGVLAVQT